MEMTRSSARQVPERIPERPEPVIIEPKDNQWEVEEIINSKIKNKKRWYQVKWKGYPLGEDEWQPATNLKDAPQLITEFYEKNPTAPGGPKYKKNPLTFFRRG